MKANKVRKCRVCNSEKKVFSLKEMFYGFRNGIYVGPYSEIIYYCDEHLPPNTKNYKNLR